MTNLLSDYGLVDAKIRASDVDLPVLENYSNIRILKKMKYPTKELFGYEN